MHRQTLRTACWMTILSALALALKIHYSLAESGDLSWILVPTVDIVEPLSGIRFEQEAYAGFVNRARGVIIAPSCAGVNFLIISFLMAGVQGILHFERCRARAAWLSFSLIAGFFLTISINSLRIIISIALHEADIHSSGIMADEAHRLMGAGLYLTALHIYFHAVRSFLNILRPAHKSAAGLDETATGFYLPRLLPLFCYLFVTLFLPLLKCPGASAQQVFLAHCSVVVGLGAAVYAAVLSAELFFLKFIRRIGPHETEYPCC